MVTLLVVILAVELGLGALEYRRAWVADAIPFEHMPVRKPAIPADNVRASHPARIRAPRAIVAPGDLPDVAALLERAIQVRGERQQQAA